ncbi:MAG: VWA domain-containing protein [Candidatus Nanohaloarchaea archaeon]
MAALSNYFLQPKGLLGLAGLLALAAFYMVKRKPEEQVMPSMTFFMQRKKQGKLQHALRKLFHNLTLLLHILLVIGFAAALAHPFLTQPTQAEKTVVILDNSASMANNLEEAKTFAKKNLGESNTLIVANSETRLILQDAEASIVKNAIERVRARDTETDLSSALQLARNFKGTIVVASDLDSTTGTEVKQSLLESDREFKTMKTRPENAWGVTAVDVSRENVSVNIKNFLENRKSISYTVNGDQESVEVPGNAVRTVRFRPEQGRNTLSLEKDALKPDNTAYAYLPREDDYRAVIITDSGNRYLEKALELIDFIDVETVKPPLQETPEADVYIIGKTDRVLSETLNRIERKVKKGDSLVVMAQRNMNDLGLKSLPVKIKGGWNTTTVQIQKPVKTSFTTETINAEKISGTSYARPAEALVRSDYGSGEVFLYNLKNTDFRSNFLYPVFWKKILADLTERPAVEELNIRTGTTINASRVVKPSGKKASFVQVNEAGFYNASGKVYAANLASEDESSEEPSEAYSSTGAGEKKKDYQSLVAVLLLLTLLGETAYLRRLGEL